MATIKIDNAASIDEFISADAISATGGGSLTVDVDAFVRASGVTFNAAALNGTSPWTVRIDGLLSSTAYSGSIGIALDMAAGNVTVSDTGAILSSGYALSTAGALTLTNAGWIEAAKGIVANSAAATVTVVNSGTILSSEGAHATIRSEGSSLKVTNSGEIRNTAGTLAGAHAIISNGLTANDTLTNSGWIVGDVNLGDGKNVVANTGLLEGELILGEQDDKLTNALGQYEGGLTGRVFLVGGKDTADNKGYIFQLDLGEGDNTLKNSGSIGRNSPDEGGLYAGAGIDTVTNSGKIRGACDLGEGNNKLTNSGTIDVKVVVGAGNDTITNSGQGNVGGGLELGNGKNVVTNSAQIHGGITAGEQDDKITNSGYVAGGVDLGKGNNIVANSGTIEGMLLGDGDDIVTNTGQISWGITLGDGNNTLTSSGTIIGDIIGGQHVDTLNISGTVSGGDIFLGDGNDKVTLSGTGKTFAVLDLGLGDDTYIGNGEANAAYDSAGSDNFNLGAGDDVFSAGASADGIDTIDGGAGIDLYVDASSTNALLVNIGADFTHAVLVGTVAKNKSTGDGTDNISNFENVIGGQSHDTIIGSGAANELHGGTGGDMLFGREGNDVLVGGNDGAKDRLYGGLGADSLWGGDDRHGNDSAVDFFSYESIAESTVALAGRDKIMDFTVGTDVVDFAAIDANTKNGAASNDVFNWLGLNGKFSGAGGELMYMNLATGWTVLYGDTNGDKKADFAIAFNGNLTLSATDFIL